MLMDTSGLMCLFDRDDSRHEDAETFFNASPFRITHNYVLAEFVALTMARGAPRKLALDFVTNIQDDVSVEIVYVDEKLHRDALNLLQERLDKTWSLCSLRSVVTS
ncbi:nucleic acid-binding protein [bacterium]|nr:nucleic acid-binding protein [bacterium]